MIIWGIKINMSMIPQRQASFHHTNLCVSTDRAMMHHGWRRWGGEAMGRGWRWRRGVGVVSPATTPICDGGKEEDVASANKLQLPGKANKKRNSHLPSQKSHQTLALCDFYLRRSHDGQWIINMRPEEKGWFTFMEYFVNTIL